MARELRTYSHDEAASRISNVSRLIGFVCSAKSHERPPPDR